MDRRAFPGADWGRTRSERDGRCGAGAAHPTAKVTGAGLRTNAAVADRGVAPIPSPRPPPWGVQGGPRPGVA